MSAQEFLRSYNAMRKKAQSKEEEVRNMFTMTSGMEM